jgi:hypothetical protein
MITPVVVLPVVVPPAGSFPVLLTPLVLEPAPAPPPVRPAPVVVPPAGLPGINSSPVPGAGRAVGPAPAPPRYRLRRRLELLRLPMHLRMSLRPPATKPGRSPLGIERAQAPIFEPSSSFSIRRAGQRSPSLSVARGPDHDGAAGVPVRVHKLDHRTGTRAPHAL